MAFSKWDIKAKVGKIGAIESPNIFPTTRVGGSTQEQVIPIAGGNYLLWAPGDNYFIQSAVNADRILLF